MSKLKSNNIAVFAKFYLAAVTTIVALMFCVSDTNASSIVSVSIEPPKITAGTSELVTVAATITDSNLVLINLQLERVDDSGVATENLGNLLDDGLNGDLAAGDGVFTTELTITESSPGLIRLRVSASVENMYKPIFSEVFILEVIE